MKFLSTTRLVCAAFVNKMYLKINILENNSLFIVLDVQIYRTC